MSHRRPHYCRTSPIYSPDGEQVATRHYPFAGKSNYFDIHVGGAVDLHVSAFNLSQMAANKLGRALAYYTRDQDPPSSHE